MLVVLAGFAGGFLGTLSSNGSSVHAAGPRPDRARGNGTNRLSVVVPGLVGAIHFARQGLDRLVQLLVVESGEYLQHAWGPMRGSGPERSALLGGWSEHFGLEQLDLLAVRPFAERVAYGHGRVPFQHHVGGFLGDGAAGVPRPLGGCLAVLGS